MSERGDDVFDEEGRWISRKLGRKVDWLTPKAFARRGGQAERGVEC